MTNIDRAVILDLLPLYLSGEASPQTRALIELYAQGDPSIAQLLNSDANLVFQMTYPLPEELEMKTLERTKRLMRVRSMLLGAAIFLSLLPLSVRGGEAGVSWMWSGAEQYAVFAGVLAIVAWSAYVSVNRRLRIAEW